MRSIEKAVLAWGMILLAFFPGCITYTTFQTPEVSPPLHFNGGGGLSVCGFFDVDSLGYYGAGTDSGPYTGSGMMAFTRFGICKNFDVGLRYIFPLDGMIDFKYKIMDAPVMVSPSAGIGGTWVGWGLSGGIDTIYHPTSLVERNDVFARIAIGKRLGPFTVFGYPLVQRTAYHVLDKTYIYYHNVLIREEVDHEARNTFYQFGAGVGFAVWRFIAEADYAISNEFKSLQVGIGFRTDR